MQSVKYTELNFHSYTVYLNNTKSLIIQLNAKVDCLENFKTYFKIYVEMLLHVSVYNHHQGAYSLCFAKVWLHIFAATRPN